MLSITIIAIFLGYCGSGLILGLAAARFRCLAAAIIASASIGFFPAALLLMEYHGPNSALSVAIMALFTAIPLAAVSAGFAVLGYYLIGRPFKEKAKIKYLNRRLNISLIIIASLIIPVFVVLDFIPPSRASQAGYYEMLITNQLNKVRYDDRTDEYELEADNRILYLHIRNDEEKGEHIWLDIYDEINAGNISGRSVEPVFKFPRIEDWMPFPDVRGAFIQDGALYYNYGKDKTVSASAFNSRLSKRYYTREFQFAKIDLTTMQNIKIDKAEYERMYAQVKENLTN